MNLEIFKQSDRSGKLNKESYLFKNHTEEYNYIIEYCQKNEIFDIPFKEKVYLCLNHISKVPTCKNPNCNKKVNFINSTLGFREYCSNKCISSDPNIKKIKEMKSLEKFGTKTPAESKLIKDKIIQTNQEKYGGNSPMSSVKIQEKSKEKLIEKWGVDNPAKSRQILDRRVESFKKSNYKESYRKTSIERYGVEHPWMNEEVHKKTIDFFYKSYKERIESKINHDQFFFKGFKKNFSTSLEFHCNECREDFDILTWQFYYRNNSGRSICTKCFPISENASISQLEVLRFIESNYDGEIISDCKGVINPYEIDIYLPELKLGFEFNGVWWHSEKFKADSYHQKKHKFAEDSNINLFSIWEDDWNSKREICQSFILNKLGKTQNKIWARKCQIKNVSYNDSRDFLIKNHLQGDCKSSIRIGLYFNNYLVSLMTFSKLRLPLQRLKSNRKENYYELTRFCNKINTNVVGGASKILKYFIQNHSPMSVETYSDNSISNGALYQTLEFTYQHTSNPGYWYVIDGIRSHRFNWRKQKLVKLGFDPNKTEEEIMSELGYYRVYNAGNKKWILKFEK
jgi:hypothetical protein